MTNKALRTHIHKMKSFKDERLGQYLWDHYGSNIHPDLLNNVSTKALAKFVECENLYLSKAAPSGASLRSTDVTY